MDVREKLLDLLLKENYLCKPSECKYCLSNGSCNYYRAADRLIANGVTVQEDCKDCAEATQNCIVKLQEQIAELRSAQEWISVDERLPQENEPEGTLCETVQVLLNNGKVSVGWCNRITKLWYHMDYDKDYYTSNDYDLTPVIAWMPLAQPPKGE